VHQAVVRLHRHHHDYGPLQRSSQRVLAVAVVDTPQTCAVAGVHRHNGLEVPCTIAAAGVAAIDATAATAAVVAVAVAAVADMQAAVVAVDAAAAPRCTVQGPCSNAPTQLGCLHPPGHVQAQMQMQIQIQAQREPQQQMKTVHRCCCGRRVVMSMRQRRHLFQHQHWP